MSFESIIPVVIAGGAGTRLWPLSRKEYPKQYLRLVGEKSLLQETIKRANRTDVEKTMVVCHENHRFIVAEQLRELELESDIILEPEGRNTAPAIALAALKLISDGFDPLMLVLAADHLIRDTEAFHAAVDIAKTHAINESLVTFGVVPTSPNTGYGYIERGASISPGGFCVSAFVEKPNSQAAAKYCDSGRYYWNGGMFLFRASRYLEELKKFNPAIHAACTNAIKNPNKDGDFFRIDRDAFLACPSDSIDYSVMEKTESATVVPLDAGWSDVGDWSSFWDVDEKDDCGNAFKGDVVLHDTTNCLVHAGNKLVATVGLDNVIVIETKDAILVASKDQAQDVKLIVEKLEESGRSEVVFHREVYRPWGYFDSLDSGKRYQVKRIMVKPGARLSLQFHRHRSEHWIVVCGTAEITKGEEKFMLSENESTYIPVGVKHSLRNPGTTPLDLIEVQSGGYLGEDDIVRLDDEYGREDV